MTLVAVVTVSWCEDCDWRDTSDVVSRADCHSRDHGHCTHTETRPAAQAHLIGPTTEES